MTETLPSIIDEEIETTTSEKKEERMCTIYFGTRETESLEKTIPLSVAKQSQTFADSINMQEEDDEDEIKLYTFDCVHPTAIEPILEYMEHYSKPDVLSIPIDLKRPDRVLICVNTDSALTVWDKKFLNKWYDCHTMEYIVAGANYLGITRLVTLAIVGVAYLMYDRRDDMKRINTDFIGFKDTLPKEKYDKFFPYIQILKKNIKKNKRIAN